MTGKTLFKFVPACAIVTVLGAGTAVADEVEVGEPFARFGMEIGAVYLQAVTMDPQHGAHLPADIHLEADVSAAKDNLHGFEEGAWIPYLGVSYEISKKDSNWRLRGDFVPMVANDGPHYGANVKLDGPGKYHLRYRFNPPSANGFYRHTDKETGVAAWWQPFDLEWDFTYVGTGKKGGY